MKNLCSILFYDGNICHKYIVLFLEDFANCAQKSLSSRKVFFCIVNVLFDTKKKIKKKDSFRTFSDESGMIRFFVSKAEKLSH